MKLFTFSSINGRVLGVLVAAGVGVLSACSYEKAIVPCALPTTVSYQTDVWPILKANCRDACHNPATASIYADFNMDVTSQVQFWTTHKLDKSAVGPTDYSALVGNIRHELGFNNMPQVGQKLTDCQIMVIEAWVKAGSPNN